MTFKSLLHYFLMLVSSQASAMTAVSEPDIPRRELILTFELGQQSLDDSQWAAVVALLRSTAQCGRHWEDRVLIGLDSFAPIDERAPDEATLVTARTVAVQEQMVRYGIGAGNIRSRYFHGAAWQESLAVRACCSRSGDRVKTGACMAASRP